MGRDGYVTVGLRKDLRDKGTALSATHQEIYAAGLASLDDRVSQPELLRDKPKIQITNTAGVSHPVQKGPDGLSNPIMACPKCASSSVYERDEMKPPYRCQDCGCEFNDEHYRERMR